MAPKRGFFTIIPGRAVDDENLTHAEFRLLGLICSYIDKENQCWPSSQTLAARAKISKRQILYILKALIDKGYISLEKRFSRKGSPLPSVISVIFDDGRRKNPEQIPEDDQEGVDNDRKQDIALPREDELHRGDESEFHYTHEEDLHSPLYRRTKPLRTRPIEHHIPPVVPHKGDDPKPYNSDNLRILKEMVDIWNEETASNGLPFVQDITDRRKRGAANCTKIIKRLGGRDGWKHLLEKISQSSFLCGKMRCSFDWVVKSDNYVKIMEGQYDDRKSETGSDLKDIARRRLEKIQAMEELGY